MQLEYITLMIFLSLLCIVSVAIVLSKDLLNTIIMQGVFSLVAVLSYSILRAPDVAITEVAVGAAVSTLFSLLVVSRVGRRVEHWSIFHTESSPSADYWWILRFAASMCFFVMMAAIVVNLHDFGNIDTAVSKGSDDLYLSRAMVEFAMEEIVTPILGAYRGFDTLIETTVSFAAAFGMRQILKKKDNF